MVDDAIGCVNGWFLFESVMGHQRETDKSRALDESSASDTLTRVPKKMPPMGQDWPGDWGADSILDATSAGSMTCNMLQQHLDSYRISSLLFLMISALVPPLHVEELPTPRQQSLCQNFATRWPGQHEIYVFLTSKCEKNGWILAGLRLGMACGQEMKLICFAGVPSGRYCVSFLKRGWEESVSVAGSPALAFAF